MQIKEIYNETVNLLGYNDLGENLNNSDIFTKDFLICVSRVITDLTDKEVSIRSLSQETDVKQGLKSTISYGTAMWLSLILGDGNRHNFFAETYSRMRTKCKTTLINISDTLPQ